MRIQEYIVPIALSSVLLFGIHHFFGDFVKKPKEEGSFTYKEKNDEMGPLIKTVSYDRTSKKKKDDPVIFEASWGTVTFNDGNVISVEYKKIADREIGSGISTLQKVDDVFAHAPSFLLAFEEKTPLFYSLQKQRHFDDRSIIEYKGDNEVATIVKQFTFYKNVHRIDLAITLTPKYEKKPLHFVRVLFQSPRTVSASGMSAVGAVVMDKNKEIVRTKDATKIENQGWITPVVFGSENHYFTHLCFKDKNHDIKRTYYMQEEDSLVSVLEFSPITEERQIELSFYMGPKELDALHEVDEGLVDIFSYKGILAPLYKLLFAMLKWLYHFLGNFGLAIIFLTIIVRLLLLPLSLYTERSQKEAKELEKKMNYITQKYKNDDEKLQLARAELIKNQGFSVIQALLFGIGTQIPLFVCLNYMFGNTVELLNAPFLWIHDLSGRDPFYILPIFVMGSMIMQSPVGGDSKKRLNAVLFALVIGALATRFSAGLGIYFVISGLFGLLQAFVIKKFTRFGQ